MVHGVVWKVMGAFDEHVDGHQARNQVYASRYGVNDHRWVLDCLRHGLRIRGLATIGMEGCAGLAVLYVWFLQWGFYLDWFFCSDAIEHGRMGKKGLEFVQFKQCLPFFELTNYRDDSCVLEIEEQPS